MSEPEPNSVQSSETAAESPLNSQILAAVEEAQRALRQGVDADSRNIVRLQIAHSLSLSLADGVAHIRRLQTLALAGQAAAQRAILDGGDIDSAERAAELGYRAVVKANRQVVEMARAALDLACDETGEDPSLSDGG